MDSSTEPSGTTSQMLSNAIGRERINPALAAWALSIGLVVTSTTLVSVLGRIWSQQSIGTGLDETVDRAVWVTALGCVAFLTAAALFTRGRWLTGSRWRMTKLASLAGLCGSLAGIAWVEPYAEFTGLWFGFGVPVALATVALAPIVLMVLTRRVAWLPIVAWMGGVLAVVTYLPTAIQPAGGQMDSFTSAYVFNEAASVLAGRTPTADFFSQYTTLAGYVLAPIDWAIGGSFSSFEQLASWLFSLAAVGQLSILVVVAYRLLPGRLRVLAPIAVLPFVLVKPQPAETLQGTLTTLLSAIPIRTSAIVVIALLLSFSRFSNATIFASIGVVAVVAALNNPEFGIPVAISTGILSILRGRPAFVSWTIGAGTSVIGLLLLIWSLGQAPPTVQGWLAFILTFGSGFGAVPMPIFGTHMLFLSALAAGCVVGVIFLRRNHDGSSALTACASVAFISGASGLGSFGYYVGRSVTSGQLQTFSIYVALVIISCIGLVCSEGLPAPSSLTASNVTPLACFLLFPALLVSSALQSPDPRYEWTRVLSSPFSVGVGATEVSKTKERTLAALDDFRSRGVLSDTASLNAAIDFGNIMQRDLGLTNVSPIDRPDDARNHPWLREAFCSSLETAGDRLVLVQDFSKGSGPLCPDMRIVAVSDVFSLVRNPQD